MHLFRQVLLLFSLNLLDAVLTIVWVRNGIAPEGNELMAYLLDMGNLPFLAAKLAMGTFAALVLLRWGDRKLARYGVSAALAVYVCVMGVHLMTYLNAVGYLTFLHVHRWSEVFASL